MATLENLTQRLSYMVGENMATQLKADGLEIDTEALSQAVNDVFAGKESAMSAEDKESVVAEIQKLTQPAGEAEHNGCSGSGCC